MATPMILNVKNKKVLTTKITYDDLVILYNQYINNYGEIPKFSKCDSEHNMPQGRIINKVLKDHGTSKEDFDKLFINCNNTKTIAIENQKKLIVNQFPIVINNISYKLIDGINSIIVVHNDRSRHNKYYLLVEDSDGYKYKTTFNIIKTDKLQNIELNRFFKRNEFTAYNINNFCKINNIGLQLLKNDISITGAARDKIDFIDANKIIHRISWNQIQRFTFQYKSDYEKVKKHNFEQRSMTKEKAIPIIKKMQENLNRPLVQSDFDGIITTSTSIGIRVVWRIWGTFNNMIDDIGLLKHDNYFKPNSNYLTHEEVMNQIQNVCENAKNDGRNVIMCSDFNNVDMSTIKRHCKLDNTTLKDKLLKYGCTLQKPGNGLNHIFDDGEHVLSKYEYDFSIFLRNNGFKYNRDYYRDVEYKEIDNNYYGGMNCDYKILFGKTTLFIELAGILGNKGHQEAYRNNTPINSKSKELYRNKLNEKKAMFERNNIDYYILLPDEMNENTYKLILEKYMKKVS